MNRKETIEHVLTDAGVRTETARASLELFFGIYLNAFITYQTAPFQKLMFEIAQNEDELLSVIVSFRGSAKTTIMSLAYPIWAILGKPQKKFVVIIADTQELAKHRLANIRWQFENNLLLKQELGPFQDDSSPWGAGSIVLPKYGARITVASREQSLRGITHNQYRPDLIILDDVENLEIVKTKEGRKKLHDWFHSDIMPLGTSDKTKIVVIGNLLHQDSLIMRLKTRIGSGKMSGGYYAFPIRVGQTNLWPGKYPDEAAIERERKKLGDDRAWLREYELRIIPDEDQIFLPEWIKHYDALPQIPYQATTYLATGIDLALVKKDQADYTAMVTARVYVRDDKPTIYILPHPINQHINFPEQRETIVNLVKSYGEPYHYLFIESFGTQGGLVEELNDMGFTAEGATPAGSKDERLRYVSHLVKNGTVLFPREGSEDLITQLVGFGVEKRDDLADAFAILLIKIMERKLRGGFSGRVHSSVKDFYGVRVGGRSEDWGDRDDRLMLNRINGRPNAWRRLEG